MKVHFITSEKSVEKDLAVHRLILKVIADAGHTLARDWVEEASSKGRKKSGDYWRRVYKENLETIAKSDAVVAEASYEDFGMGYMIAAAVQQKKPILLLRHDTADKSSFVVGIVDNWVRHESYEDSVDLEGKIMQFLDDNTIATKDMRFNFFIDRQIYNYLRWASVKTGKTKAEILRELIVREIEDKQY